MGTEKSPVSVSGTYRIVYTMNQFIGYQVVVGFSQSTSLVNGYEKKLLKKRWGSEEPRSGLNAVELVADGIHHNNWEMVAFSPTNAVIGATTLTAVVIRQHRRSSLKHRDVAVVETRGCFALVLWIWIENVNFIRL